MHRHASLHQSSLSQVSTADDKAKDLLLVPCKRMKEEKHTLYLPRDIIFNILIHIPADILNDVVRYVCRQWFEIVKDPDFIRVHRQVSPAGFLIEAFETNAHPSYGFQVYNIEADTDRLKVTKVDTPATATILCCYNALVLLSDSTNKEILHVVNLVTKVKFSLPPLVGLRNPPESVGLAVDSSGHYKVVHVSGKATFSQPVHISVFTIGADKAWRFIDLQCIPFNLWAVKSLILDRPYCLGGFVYWFTNLSWKSNRGLALDVDTETIYQISKPNGLARGDRLIDVLGIGSGIGLIYAPSKQFIWKFWKLTDVKSDQWIELACIKVGELYRQFGYIMGSCPCLEIIPVRLFRGDLWLYHRVSDDSDELIVIRYNVDKESFKAFKFEKSRLQSSDSPSPSKHLVFTKELLADPSFLSENFLFQ